MVSTHNVVLWSAFMSYVISILMLLYNQHNQHTSVVINKYYGQHTHVVTMISIHKLLYKLLYDQLHIYCYIVSKYELLYYGQYIIMLLCSQQTYVVISQPLPER